MPFKAFGLNQEYVCILFSTKEEEEQSDGFGVRLYMEHSAAGKVMPIFTSPEALEEYVSANLRTVGADGLARAMLLTGCEGVTVDPEPGREAKIWKPQRGQEEKEQAREDT